MAIVQADFGSPWPGLAFSLPRCQTGLSPYALPGKPRRLTPSSPFPTLLASPAWLQGDNQTGIPPPRGPSLTLQVFNSHRRLQGLQLQLESPCPVASSSGHGGYCRHRLAHTSKNQDPQPGGREAGRTPACTPALSTRGGRLPPGTSQLWLSLEATLRPSHSSPVGQWWRVLSCSGPLCPPPAPACSGAAAGEPARPCPGPSGSRPCTW